MSLVKVTIDAYQNVGLLHLDKFPLQKINCEKTCYPKRYAAEKGFEINDIQIIFLNKEKKFTHQKISSPFSQFSKCQ